MKTLKEVEHHYQSLIRIRDKRISDLKDELDDLRQIVDGMSSTYMRRYSDIVAKMGVAEKRVMEYLKHETGKWIGKDVVEERVRMRYRGQYHSGTIPRCLRKLAESGVLLVKYVDNHPFYTINLKEPQK